MNVCSILLELRSNSYELLKKAWNIQIDVILQPYGSFPVSLTWEQVVPKLDEPGKDLLQVTTRC